MFRFLTRSPKPRGPSLLRRVRPGVECLEGRDCPSAPQVALAATVLTGRTVQLTGTVMATHPDSVALTFSGVMTGMTRVLKSGPATGTFSFTGQASALGMVRAVGVDDQGLSSNVALAAVTSVTPLISLSATPGGGNSVILSGHVTDPSPSGLTVVIGGGASATTTTNANGDFSVIVNANTAAAITAYTTDVWGETSNTAATVPGASPATTTPPTISNFSVYPNKDGTVTISGQVIASNLQGVTVQLGGMTTLSNQGPLSVNGSGWFTIDLTLQDGEDGTATAQATDANGNHSGFACFDVR
jgi:hypothetical protein